MTYIGETDFGDSSVLPTLVRTVTSLVNDPDKDKQSAPSISPVPTGPSPSKNVAAIAGGVVGGFAVLVILVLGLVWTLRRDTRNHPAAPTVPYTGM